jgi:hypothetical protein
MTFPNKNSSISRLVAGLNSLGLIPKRRWDSSLCHHVQTGYGAYLAFRLTGTGSSFPRDKQLECNADLSPPHFTEV